MKTELTKFSELKPKAAGALAILHHSVNSVSKGRPRVSNEDLVKRCYAATHEAADDVSRLHLLKPAPQRLELVKKLRNELREAYCAIQELKTRLKREPVEPQRRRDAEKEKL